MNVSKAVKASYPWIRIFRWSLAVLFATAYLLSEGESIIHPWSGYLIIGLLAFSLIWWFISPQHAHFSGSIFSLKKIIAYAKVFSVHAGRFNKANKTSKFTKRWIMATTFSVVFFSGAYNSQAAFELNFDPRTNTDHNYISTNDYISYSCHMSFYNDFMCAPGGGWNGDFQLNGSPGSHDDGTPFFHSTFTYGGKEYYHYIVGDIAAGDQFGMETIIEANASWGDYWGFGTNAPANASAGNTSTTANKTWNMDRPYSTDIKGGNGSGNPERVIFRLILDETGGSMNTGTSTYELGAVDGTYNEIYKPYFDKKHFISQKVIDTAGADQIFVEYTMDMTAKLISDTTAIGQTDATNITILGAGSDRPGDQGDYDTTGANYTPYLMNQSTPYTTAGAWTYTAGSDFGGSNGTYSYYQINGVDPSPDEGFYPVGLNYAIFCDPAQNPNWSGNGACMDGTGGGGGGWGSRGW